MIALNECPGSSGPPSKRMGVFLKHYILDKNNQLVEIADLIEWATWFENSSERRIVKVTEGKGLRVSTVFLGYDHQFGDGPPLLFETMVFNSDNEEQGWETRYSTWDEAVAGHERICAEVFK